MTPAHGLRVAVEALRFVLVAQAIIWILSGAYLALTPDAEEAARANAPFRVETELAARSYASPGGAIAQAPGATSLRLMHFLDRPVWLAEGPAGAALFDARTSERLSPLAEEQARLVAARAYVGPGDIARMELVDSPSAGAGAASGVGARWIAHFDDRARTRIHVSAESGLVTLRRNAAADRREAARNLHVWDIDGPSGPSPAFAAPAAFVALAGVLALAAPIIARRRARRRPTGA